MGVPAGATTPRGVIVRRSSVELARPTLLHLLSQWWSRLRLWVSERRSRRSLKRRRSSVRSSPLVLDVVNYCNTMMIDGHFKRQELYPPAMQAYYADYYRAQVYNGGHSQFVGNARDKLSTIIEEARKGLTAMGATEHLAFLEKAAEWVRANPGEAMLQTGFEGGRADGLDALDAPFFAAEKAKGMAELSAKWILSWSELQVVEDADYPAAIISASGVPSHRTGSNGGDRHVRIAQIIQANAADVTQVGIGLACGAADRIPYTIGTVPYTEINWVPALFIGTGGRTFCFCAVTEDRITLYTGTLSPSSTPLPPAPTGDRLRDARDRPNGGMPQPGESLAEISVETAETAVAFAARDQLGGAVSLLLAKAGIAPVTTTLSAAGIETKLERSIWTIIVGSQILTVTQSPSQTVLSDYKTRAVIATVEADEIATFAEQVR